MLYHADVWRAIDRIAEKAGISTSALARKAGLSSTLLNPSKRETSKRKRWPSTESVALILQATGTSLDEFVALASPTAAQQTKVLVLESDKAEQQGFFNDQGFPIRERWDIIPLPASSDAAAFALEISGHQYEPMYRQGDILVLTPSEKPRRGDRVAARMRQGDILIRELGREGVAKFELLPLNPEETPITVAREDFTWVYRITWASQ